MRLQELLVLIEDQCVPIKMKSLARLGMESACSLLYLLYFILGELRITVYLEYLMLLRSEVVEELLAIRFAITKVEVLNLCHHAINKVLRDVIASFCHNTVDMLFLPKLN